MDFSVASTAQQDALPKFSLDGLKAGHPVRDREVFLPWIDVVKVHGQEAAVIPTNGALPSKIGNGLFSEPSTSLSNVKSTAPSVHGKNTYHKSCHLCKNRERMGA